MAERTSTKPGNPAGKRGTDKASGGFTKEEREAMRERAREMKSAGGEGDVLAAIARMSEPDRGMATRLHAIVKANAPELAPKTWYGMPAYADSEGKVVCFFRNASKFKERYATFGFNEKAKLDDGNMWPIAFALTTLTAAEERRIVALVKQAVG